MEMAFHSLRKLVWVIEAKPCMKSIHLQLIKFLGKCLYLEWLNLSIQWLTSYWIIDNEPPRCHSDIFTSLTDMAPWLNLQRLELTAVIKSTALLQFLYSVNSTLQSLNLTHCSLVDSDGPVWDSVLRDIARRVQLKELVLAYLSDFPLPRSSTRPTSPQRQLFGHIPWSGLSSWHENGGILYNHYYKSIIHACLHYTGADWHLPPLDPAKFLKEHLQRCAECGSIYMNVRNCAQKRGNNNPRLE